MNLEVFDLEYQYRQYLKLTKQSEEQMHPIQAIETKRAFMGACGQMIMLFTNDLPELDEADAMTVITDLRDQVGAYWQKETNRSN